MSKEFWQHQFTKRGPTKKVAEDEYGDPVFEVEMVCVHCGVEYVNGRDNRPPDPCPARSDKKELNRLHS